MTDRREVRTWAAIDLDALTNNYRLLRDLLPEGCRLLAPVKANGYGHGAVPVAGKLERLGADMLSVACVDEGAELRRAGIRTPILCMGVTPAQLTGELLDLDITQTVEDLESGEALSRQAQRLGRKLRVHLKVDTGMGRLGVYWGDGDHTAAVRELLQLCRLPGLEVEGMFTHFAVADSDEAYTRRQLDRFLEARAALEEQGISLKICHCAASSAVLHYPCTHMDMVRPGIALYGYYPDPEGDRDSCPPLKPVMRLYSRISAVRSMPAGARISYGGTAVLKRDSRLAVLPIGYGDGLPRVLSNRMQVRIGDKLCPVVGRVCMDMCMADVTDLPQVRAGDVAQIYGDGLTDRAAAQADTISYELLCRVAPRVPRIYWENGVRLD